MRKTLTLLLLLCFACVLCVAGIAADITPSSNPNTEMTVTYGADSRYTLYIPETIVINPKTHTGSAELSIANVVLPTNTIMIFEVNSQNAHDGKWYLVSSEGEQVEYTIYSGLMGEVLPGDVFWCSSEILGQGMYTETCNFAIVNPAHYANVYYDIITYTISIGTIENNPVCWVCGGEFIWNCQQCPSYERCRHICAICPTCPACYFNKQNPRDDACIHCTGCNQCVPAYESHVFCSECQKCVSPPDFCYTCNLCYWCCDTKH